MFKRHQDVLKNVLKVKDKKELPEAVVRIIEDAEEMQAKSGSINGIRKQDIILILALYNELKPKEKAPAVVVPEAQEEVEAPKKRGPGRSKKDK